VESRFKRINEQFLTQKQAYRCKFNFVHDKCLMFIGYSDGVEILDLISVLEIQERKNCAKQMDSDCIIL
jgi:hypothetical protein